MDRLEKEGGGEGQWCHYPSPPPTTLSLDAHTHVHKSSRTHDLAADTNNRLTAHTAHTTHTTHAHNTHNTRTQHTGADPALMCVIQTIEDTIHVEHILQRTHSEDDQPAGISVIQTIDQTIPDLPPLYPCPRRRRRRSVLRTSYRIGIFILRCVGGERYVGRKGGRGRGGRRERERGRGNPRRCTPHVVCGLCLWVPCASPPRPNTIYQRINLVLYQLPPNAHPEVTRDHPLVPPPPRLCPHANAWSENSRLHPVSWRCRRLPPPLCPLPRHAPTRPHSLATLFQRSVCVMCLCAGPSAPCVV